MQRNIESVHWRAEVTACVTFDDRMHTQPLLQGIKEKLFSFVCVVGKHKMSWKEDYKSLKW